jgi:hypothetical protein
MAQAVMAANLASGPVLDRALEYLYGKDAKPVVAKIKQAPGAAKLAPLVTAAGPDTNDAAFGLRLGAKIEEAGLANDSEVWNAVAVKGRPVLQAAVTACFAGPPAPARDSSGGGATHVEQYEGEQELVRGRPRAESGVYFDFAQPEQGGRPRASSDASENGSRASSVTSVDEGRLRASSVASENGRPRAESAASDPYFDLNQGTQGTRPRAASDASEAGRSRASSVASEGGRPLAESGVYDDLNQGARSRASSDASEGGRSRASSDASEGGRSRASSNASDASGVYDDLNHANEQRSRASSVSSDEEEDGLYNDGQPQQHGVYTDVTQPQPNAAPAQRRAWKPRGIVKAEKGAVLDREGIYAKHDNHFVQDASKRGDRTREQDEVRGQRGDEYEHEEKVATFAPRNAETSKTVERGRIEKTAYLDAQGRKPFEARVEAGQIVFVQDGKPVDTASGAKMLKIAEAGRFIFVLSTAGVLYLADAVGESHARTAAGDGDNINFHHTSFLSGDDVLAAGDMRIVDGKLIAVSNHSGHYKMKGVSNSQILAKLGELGVDTSAIKVDIVDGSTVTRATGHAVAESAQNYKLLEAHQEVMNDIAQPGGQARDQIDRINKPPRDLADLTDGTVAKANEVLAMAQTLELGGPALVPVRNALEALDAVYEQHLAHPTEHTAGDVAVANRAVARALDELQLQIQKRDEVLS